MQKIFTRVFLGGFKKFFLVTAFAFVCATVNSYPLHRSYPSEFGIQAKTVKCYPNPAISFVNFEFPAELVSKNYSLQIFSFTGKKMYETEISSIKSTLVLNNEFSRGIYVYQLRDKTGKILETGKFQVAR